MLGGCADVDDTATESTALKFPTLPAYSIIDATNVLLSGSAVASNAKVVAGDFNGDDHADLAIVGHDRTNVRFGFSNGDGTFTLVHRAPARFAGWASQAGVQVVAGDFDGNGCDDLALAGGATWTSIPIAFCRGSSLVIANVINFQVAGWAKQTNVKLRAGDVDGDGRDDLVLIGGTAWTTVPVAFSKGDGSFHTTNQSSPLAMTARSSAIQVAIGDFDDNGQADVALAAGPGDTITIGFAAGGGRFSTSTVSNASFAAMARESGAKLLAGDSNRDGADDLLLIGGAGRTTIPALLAHRDGTFSLENPAAGSFPTWAASSTVHAVAGDFDRDGMVDLALTGSGVYPRVPVALRRRLLFTLPETAAERGARSRVEVDCEPLSDEVDDVIDLVCAVLPNCWNRHVACKRYERELTTGTELERRLDAPASTWNHLGDNGEDLANAGLCLLADLARGPLVSETPKAGAVSATQEVGFVKFDHDARSVTAYQMVGVCLPMVGCLDLPPHTFTAQVVKSDPEHPIGATVNPFDVRGAYALKVTSDESTRSVILGIPPIPIYTPWGLVSIEPQLTYSSWLQTIDSPMQSATHNDVLSHSVQLSDVYGRTPGVEIVQDPPLAGWWSQLAIGSRNAAPGNDTLWSGNGARPDLDLSTPRWDTEHLPTHALDGDLDIVYDITGLIPDSVRSLLVDIHATVTITVHVDARATGQVSLAAGQAAFEDVDNPSWRSLLDLRSNVSAAETLTVTPAFDFRAKIPLVFLDPISIHIHIEHTLELASPTAEGVTKIARATLDEQSPGATFYSSMDTFHGEHLDRSGAGELVGACLAEPTTTATLPKPSYSVPSEPWTPSLPYPCNVCVGAPNTGHGNTARAALVCPPNSPCPLETRASGASGHWDCAPSTVGCFDICRYENGVPAVIQTAAQIKPDYCKVVPR